MPSVGTTEQWLACELEWGDGRPVTRFGPDEADPGDLPEQIGFSTQNPGGYGDGSVTLKRPPWIRAEDAPLFASARFYGPGGKTRYEGRVRGSPQVGVDAIRIDFEGWSAHLDDDEAFRFFGVHNDLTEWGGPSIQRQLDLLAISADVDQDGGAEQDTTGLSALATRLTGAFARAVHNEKWLDVDNMAIGEMRGSWRKNDNIVLPDADWAWYGFLADDDVATDATGTANLAAAGPGTFTVTTPAGSTYRRALVKLYYGDAGGSADLVYDVFFTPSVFGAHGLTPRALDDGRWGLRGDDILGYALQTGAPLLNYDSTLIDPSTFLFPHVVHTDGGVRGLVEYVTAYGGSTYELNDWGVYEDRKPFWLPPGQIGRTWRVRRDQVVTPNEEGPTADERCSGVVIVYTDGAGQSKSVGPPGSGADTETAALEDTDPSNPATRLGSSRRKRRSAGLTYEEGAVFIGQAVLAEQNQATRRGSATIEGTAEDESGNVEPACAVRACDRLLVEDEPGVAPELQPVNSTDYSHDDLTCNANLGATPHRVEILLARAESALQGVA